MVQRVHAFGREDPHPASTAPLPAQGTGTVQQFDDVPAQEVQVCGLTGRVVAEGVSQMGHLRKHRHINTGTADAHDAQKEKVIPPERASADSERSLAQGDRGEGGGEPSRGIPESCACAGWDKGYGRDVTGGEEMRVRP